MVKKKLLLLSVMFVWKLTFSQTVIPLYRGIIPNSIKHNIKEVIDSSKQGRVVVRNVSVPDLTVFYPENSNGTAIILCPGGGYSGLAINYENAKLFNQLGITVFVLKYRLPDDRLMINKETCPLQDLQQALKIVRQRSFEWKINRLGVLGFSAGGHLAGMAGVRFDRPVIENSEHINLRPDFMVLIYPVVSFEEYAHKGSKDNLIGKNPDKEIIREFSNEYHVTPATPPVFIVHAGDDTVVSVKNSLKLYEAMLEKAVPAEMHIYPKGGHGFGMVNPNTPDLWLDRCKNWMLANGWI